MTINEIRLQAANAGSSSVNISGSDLLTILNTIPVPDGVKVYRALLSQSGTDAPVATVLENTLVGEVVWTYDNEGFYTATLAGRLQQIKFIALNR